ncbi:myb/SANT-like DNA-binding domain-containing protein 3 [Ornithodoros turicata]|uniref:myb/SANT-like DNA-binding domain-containing protein 3 n=1 Tax=Ornithodoros turicata TaxID=34597 RepID=UPI0031389CC0
MSKRTLYMSADDTAILMELTGRYKRVLENEKTDSVSTKAEQDTCGRLTSQFNSMPGVVCRNSRQLRKAWDNLKTKWKKTPKGVTKTMSTGGGGLPSPMDPLLEQVQSLVPYIATRVHNLYDGDRQSAEVDDLLLPMVQARRDEGDIEHGHPQETYVNSESTEEFCCDGQEQRASQNDLADELHEEPPADTSTSQTPAQSNRASSNVVLPTGAIQSTSTGRRVRPYRGRNAVLESALSA